MKRTPFGDPIFCPFGDAYVATAFVWMRFGCPYPRR